jgi:hypothetical protein
MTMIPRERAPYSAIVDRPKMKLPDNGKIIVWTIVNLEVWDISKPMARQVGTNTACASDSGAFTTFTKSWA